MPIVKESYLGYLVDGIDEMAFSPDEDYISEYETFDLSTGNVNRIKKTIIEPQDMWNEGDHLPYYNYLYNGRKSNNKKSIIISSNSELKYSTPTYSDDHDDESENDLNPSCSHDESYFSDAPEHMLVSICNEKDKDDDEYEDNTNINLLKLVDDKASEGDDELEDEDFKDVDNSSFYLENDVKFIDEDDGERGDDEDDEEYEDDKEDSRKSNRKEKIISKRKKYRKYFYDNSYEDADDENDDDEIDEYRHKVKPKNHFQIVNTVNENGEDCLLNDNCNDNNDTLDLVSGLENNDNNPNNNNNADATLDNNTYHGLGAGSIAIIVILILSLVGLGVFFFIKKRKRSYKQVYQYKDINYDNSENIFNANNPNDSDIPRGMSQHV